MKTLHLAAKMRARLRCRLFSARQVIFVLVVVAFAAYCYYYTSGPSYEKQTVTGDNPQSAQRPVAHYLETRRTEKEAPQPEQCVPLQESYAAIDTVATYTKFDFQPSWVKTKEFWDKPFEDRYELLRNDTKRPKLKVIVVPHSHNDPGWLKTFEQYFEIKSKRIINNIIAKLQQYPNMTFIWSEVAFLNSWWELAHPMKQKAMKKLIKQGRLEITTGGWVMPDEACTHIYSLLDQFIEGHLWVKNNLGVSPKNGWSIDPFGHGPTVPHLLDRSGLKGAIIQRIHYAWKQWLAENQVEEFYWLPGWTPHQRPGLVVHNQPFDIYSIKSTCGPHPSVCLSFDFRKIPGEYTEYSSKHEDITEHNVHAKSRTLLEEYERIGTLTPHNVVLVPLGDDFRYEYDIEFDAQYRNYDKMFQYINSHPELFNSAQVQFGTPSDYFREMKKRHKNIPSLRGDFFVYSDIFSEGKPAYWSGYYTTRPYLKILARQFEHQLRTAEILFTLVYNYIKQSQQSKFAPSEKRLERAYEQLIQARRNLGIFQHHDAITGTSKAHVMYDYGTKMFTSLYHCIRLQELALTTVMVDDEAIHSQNILQSETEWETFGQPVKKLQVSLSDKNKIILFNPLIEERTEVITLRSNTTNIRVYDTFRQKYAQYQISPNIDIRQNGKHVPSDTVFDLLFVATLPPLTAITYNLENFANFSKHALVFCNNCEDEPNGEIKEFVVKKMMPGDIQLENKVLKLLINRNTGFLRQIYRKDMKKKSVVDMSFGAYNSAQRRSGAYLFQPDLDAPEKNVLSQYMDSPDDSIIIVSGPVATEITMLYLPFMVHTVRIYNVDDHALARAVQLETIVDFENPPKNRETELFMRIQTNIQNGEQQPVFFTDQNGFQYQKRVKVNKLGIEANYYPITTMAWLEDEETRLTLVTNHAQGAAGFEPGRLEVMLDRRMLYDDFRGLGEGVVDNKPTLFQHWLVLESIEEATVGRETSSDTERHFVKRPDPYPLPSQTADYLSRTLNYPVNVYIVDSSESGAVAVNTHRQFTQEFPPGLHLVTLRTLTDDILDQFPSSSCLMVLQRPGTSCSVGGRRALATRFTQTSKFNNVIITNLTSVSLTGLETRQSLSRLDDIVLKQMDLKTFRIRF